MSFRAGNVVDLWLIQPGQSFTLDAGALSTGNYVYLCRLHPWMNDEIAIK